MLGVRKVVNLLWQHDSCEKNVVDGKTDDEYIRARDTALPVGFSAICRRLPDTDDERQVRSD